MKQTTTQLLNDILQADEQKFSLLIQNCDFQEWQANELLYELIKQSKITPNQVAKQLGQGNYIYEILNGKKKPSRNMLIQILIVISCDLRTTNYILRLYQHSPLYPKYKLDCFLIFAIKHEYSLTKTESFLFENQLSLTK